MVDQTTNAPARGPELDSDLSKAGSRLDKERQALSETLGDTRDAVAAEARTLGDQAASRLGAEAEGLRDEATAGLSAFSDALKSASEELSGRELGFAGDIVHQAAGGLESLARSLEGRSPGEMLDGIRSFGRQNPVGFIAGSVLAGFALGRIAAAVPSGRGRSMGGGTPAGGSMTGSSGMGGASETGGSAGSGSGASTSGQPVGTGPGTRTGTPVSSGVGSGTGSTGGSSVGGDLGTGAATGPSTVGGGGQGETWPASTPPKPGQTGGVER